MSITLDQVTKRYQSHPVVNDVSLEIQQGEFLVLLGPSGSGKSTLLRAIAGLVEVDHGRVSLHGRDVTGVAARDRGVGFVFQHYALFRHMSVADNVEFALRVRRMRRSERMARRAELLKLVALEGMDERLPTQLSGGQQQRVAVARALAHRPEVLLLDEPFGALDAKIREELRRTIRQIQQELGVTTILVTHDQDEAFAMADRIGVMHQGRLLEVGTPDDLYARPRTRFVATFLGAANLLLGYRRGAQLRFERPGAEAVTSREIVAVIRPEEVELNTTESPEGLTHVGTGVVEELQFAGAIERLRVRMSMDGPMPATPDRDGADGSSWLLDASRTFPEQRAKPLAVGEHVTVSARRIHSLPTPITSFTAIARERARGGSAPRHAVPRDARGAHADPHHDAHRAHLERAAGHAGARGRAGRRRDGALEPLARRLAGARAAGRRPAAHAHRRAAGRGGGRRGARRRREPAPPRSRGVGAARGPRSDDARARTRLAPAGSCSMRAPRRSPTTASTFAPSFASATRTSSSCASFPWTRTRCWCSGSTRVDGSETTRLQALLEGPQAAAGADRARGRGGLSMAGGRFVASSPLPGFGLTFGFTTFFLSAVILLPLAAMVIRALGIPLSDLVDMLLDERAVASYRLSFGAAALAAAINAVFGFIVAWSLVRYDFPGRRLLDTMIDLPFALPTAVSGIALATVFSPTGWLGQKLALAGIQVAYTWLGVVVALVLIGLPFVVRSVQPALIEVRKELEDAAESLGAGGFHVFRRIILPTVMPALATGFTLAFARGIGEYGSVVFISGNLPFKTEITPLLIVIKLEQYDYNGAAALGFFMLAMSFVMLFAINLVQGWGQRRLGIGVGR